MNKNSFVYKKVSDGQHFTPVKGGKVATEIRSILAEVLRKKRAEIPVISAERIKTESLQNHYEPKTESGNIESVDVVAIPTFPDTVQNFMQYALIIILKVKRLGEAEMDEIIMENAKAKTKVITNWQQIGDIDIIVIADDVEKGANLKFHARVRRKAQNGEGGRGSMAFSAKQGGPFIRKAVLEILGKWLSARTKAMDRALKQKGIVIYGTLRDCWAFVSGLGEYLLKKAAEIMLPIRRRKEAKEITEEYIREGNNVDYNPMDLFDNAKLVKKEKRRTFFMPS